MEELLVLIERLNISDEVDNLEAKKASEMGKSILETVCAFSNEPGMGGGHLLLGVEKEKDTSSLFPAYIASGVHKDKLDELQINLASQCADVFNIPVRPQIKVHTMQNEKSVIVVYVPELSNEQKPLFFKNIALPKGAYRRIGAADHRCTEDDLAVFYQSNDTIDKAIIADAEMEDIDENAIELYRKLRTNVNPTAEELSYGDMDLLRSLNAIRKLDNVYFPTYTGLLCFGKRMALRRLMPMVRVDYIRLSTNEWVQDPDKRFESTLDMRGSLLELVQRIIHTISDDLPRGFVLTDENIQAQNIGLPLRVLREAVVNALIHRSYRENSPIQIIRYPNRIEISNPGFSLKSEEQLGEPGSVNRNPFIASVFHETNLAETKGSGIRTMRNLMEKVGMMVPTFESSRESNKFTARLLMHHFLNEEDIIWLQQFDGEELNDNCKRILIFVREVGAIDNSSARQINGTDHIQTNLDLRKLRELELLEQKGKNKFTYYVPCGSLLQLIPKNEESIIARPSALLTELSALPPKLSALPTSLSALPKTKIKKLESIKDRIDLLPLRINDKTILEKILIEMCAIHSFKLNELARFIGKSEKYIFRDFIKPLLENKTILYKYPDMINHPEQAYLSNKKKKE